MNKIDNDCGDCIHLVRINGADWDTGDCTYGYDCVNQYEIDAPGNADHFKTYPIPWQEVWEDEA